MQTLEISRPQKRFYQRRWFKITVGVLAGLLVVSYVAVCVYIADTFTKSSRTAPGTDTPATFGMPYEDISFKTVDSAALTLRGWWVPRQGSDKVLIMVHPGVYDRLYMLPISQRMWQAGYNILLYDSRGLGTSDDARFTFGLKEKYDVISAAGYLKDRGFAPGKIGVIAWSMGGAEALYAMAESAGIKAGLIESTYGNLDRLLAEKALAENGIPGILYPGIKVVANLFYGVDIDKANPEAAIKLLGQRKVYLVHAGNDEVAPVADFPLLVKAGGENVAGTWVVPGVTHVKSFENYPDEYTRRAVEFFNQELQ